MLVFHPVTCTAAGGVDDVGQLRTGFQSPHRLDPASGEVGENGRPEQVILSYFLSPSVTPHFQLFPAAKLTVALSGPWL